MKETKNLKEVEKVLVENMITDEKVSDNLKAIDWIDSWRNNCAHSRGRDGSLEACYDCYSRKECDKAIIEIRKAWRNLAKVVNFRH